MLAAISRTRQLPPVVEPDAAPHPETSRARQPRLATTLALVLGTASSAAAIALAITLHSIVAVGGGQVTAAHWPGR
ncbi:MAG TPA: hypothetical protein VFQ44_21910 [Streptosporangiaceae bacterium]|nr:hypothetical protein [Streptosporangiaceae bacterium]